jgi:hypothetical protein
MVTLRGGPANSSVIPMAPAFSVIATEGTHMRAYHVIAVVAVILVGVGVTLIFFTAQTAEANSLSIKRVGVDVSQLHQNVKNLPVQKFHDMSLVFPGGD